MVTGAVVQPAEAEVAVGDEGAHLQLGRPGPSPLDSASRPPHRVAWRSRRSRPEAVEPRPRIHAPPAPAQARGLDQPFASPRSDDPRGGTPPRDTAGAGIEATWSRTRRPAAGPAPARPPPGWRARRWRERARIATTGSGGIARSSHRRDRSTARSASDVARARSHRKLLPEQTGQVPCSALRREAQ